MKEKLHSLKDCVCMVCVCMCVNLLNMYIYMCAGKQHACYNRGLGSVSS